MDDPNLIRKSMKRKERKKKRSEMEWKARLDSVEAKRKRAAESKVEKRKVTKDASEENEASPRRKPWWHLLPNQPIHPDRYLR